MTNSDERIAWALNPGSSGDIAHEELAREVVELREMLELAKSRFEVIVSAYQKVLDENSELRGRLAGLEK